jgi:phosphoribosylamine---glycine ligase
MKTMIVGSGGREHAFAIAGQEADAELVFTQANAGMERLGRDLKVGNNDVEAITNAAHELDVDLAIIGPEAPLAAGLADALRAEDIPVVGFGAEAARLESSKIFANDFMDEFGILKPASVPAYNVEDALFFIRNRRPGDYVIKADGLEAGKGVTLPESKKEARQALARINGPSVLFQERLHGEEISLIALFDGEAATVLFMGQDYKRLLDKDKGPNTGGMGSYGPVPRQVVSKRQFNKMYEALDQTLYGLESRDITDPGIIYIGFMLAEEFGGDPAVMEYNMRFGDPEAQAAIALLQDGGVDTHDLMHQAALGRLECDRQINHAARRLGRSALTVCLAAAGYPEAPRRGEVMYGLNRDYPGVTVHHAATEYRQDEGGRVFTGGGRIAYVTGIGDSLEEAKQKAYGAIGEDGINFQDMQFRTDIGKRAIKAVKKSKK